MATTIVLVEDDPSIREMLRYYFQSVGYGIDCYESGEEYFDSAERKVPSIFILDIMLPGMDGLEILARLKQQEETREIPVIMLTAKSAEMDKVTGLEAGADDYVVKPFGVMELLARVKTVLRRYTAKQKDMKLYYRDLVIDQASREVWKNGKAIALTFKEYELLTFLILNRGLVLSRNEIMQNIWNYDYMGETRTVDMHIMSLRAKLGEDVDEPKYIMTVRGVGYKMNS